tara:strand:+ start:1076 stop:2119 length:1044 start_codon:yes stop_codon:yes gene_type:complete
MTMEDAEAAFAGYVELPKMPDVGRTRTLLRNTLMQRRVADDNGVPDVATLHDKHRRRKLRAEEHAKFALERGVGAAANRIGVAELMFGDPMPNCERWGPTVALTLSGSIFPLQQHQTLGLEARPSLPTAATVGADDRIGPHGLLTNQMRPHQPPIITYHDVLRDTFAKTVGEQPVDYGLAVAVGVSIERTKGGEKAESSSAKEPDPRSDQEDGLRYWPPRALRGDVEANAVAAVVDALADSLRVEQDDRRGAPGRAMRTLGSAVVSRYWTKCDEQMRGALRGVTPATPATLGDFRALGLCAHTRRHDALRTIKQRAQVLAIISHATQRPQLGRALEKLCVELTKLGA